VSEAKDRQKVDPSQDGSTQAGPAPAESDALARMPWFGHPDLLELPSYGRFKAGKVIRRRAYLQYFTRSQMIIINKDRLMQFLVGPDFLPNNSGYDFEHRQIEITKKLVYDHHATQLPVAVLKANSEAKQTGPMEATKARYWYRAMTKEEFDYLVKNDVLNINYEDAVEEGVKEEDNRYIGIATNSKYASAYMGNRKKHTHLIEFDVDETLNLHDEIQKMKPKGENVSNPKPEGDGGTYGLGVKGHYKGKAGECFNRLLRNDQINWRIVLLYLTYNCPDKIGRQYYS
jgi:hypothetical protein